jgi:hypothetical protein
VSGYAEPYAPLMTPRPMPAWPLPVMALVQVWFATVFVVPLREPGAPWSLSYAVLSGIAGLAAEVDGYVWGVNWQMLYPGLEGPPVHSALITPGPGFAHR